MENPLDGILPDFTIFGAQFTELWQKILAGAWGIAIVIAIIYLIVSIAGMSTASGAQNPNEYKNGRQKAIGAGIALALLAALAVIVTAIFALVS